MERGIELKEQSGSENIALEGSCLLEDKAPSGLIVERGIELEAHGRDKGLGPGDKVRWEGTG